MIKLLLPIMMIASVQAKCPDYGIDYSCGGQNYPIHLTFDDGPHPTNTAKILDILKSEDVKASFFILTEKLVDKHGQLLTTEDGKNNLKLLERMQQEGMKVGSHTFSHIDHETTITEKRAIDWRRNIDLGFPEPLEKFLDEPPPPIIRLPYGSGYFDQHSKNPQKKLACSEIMDAIDRHDAIHVGWNIDSEDWAHSETKQRFLIDAKSNEYEYFKTPFDFNRHYIKGIVTEICNGHGGIVLMHDHTMSVEFLPCLIKNLKESGHHFVDSVSAFVGFGYHPKLVGREDTSDDVICRHFEDCLGTSPSSQKSFEPFQKFADHMVKERAKQHTELKD